MWQAKTAPSLLKPLIDAGYELIPLRHNDKRPQDKRWLTRPYKNTHAVEHMEQGNNVGVRLRATELVIDVDPRNFEDVWQDTDPFSEFVLQFGLNPETWPQAITGGGGAHYYLQKPIDAPIAEKLSGFPGVEFKTYGRQVVAPGSIHPKTGRLYTWDPLDDDLSSVPQIPEAVLQAIELKVVSTPTKGGRECSPEEIERMLDGLDPTEFNNYEEWFGLMCACHHGSGGEAESEFIEWSISDPVYANDAGSIGRKWNSLNADNMGRRITVRTLYRHLARRKCERLIPRPSAKEDFASCDDADEEGEPVLDNDTPILIASEMLKGQPLVRHNGEWFKYYTDVNHYKAMSNEGFTAWCWKWIDDRPYIDRSKAEPVTKKLIARKHVVANVEEAARSLRQGPNEEPHWIKPGPNDPPPAELMVCANGLLHLPTRSLLSPDQHFFSINGSPVNFDPEAAKPERWLRFMEELFPDESDCIVTLQEATGYFLTQDTSLQKIIQFVGPSRAGKGVYTRVLQDLIGLGGYTSPTTRGISSGFGLQSFIGKQLAVVSDLRLGKRDNHGALIETLLTVSGEDSVSIQRKYLDNWEGKLNTRFLLVSNEILQLRDTSDALGARMIVVITKQSFLGREDESLTDKLRTELPGILNWALEGLDRLQDRGHFLQPQSCIDEVRQMHTMTSPVKRFLDTQTIVGPGHMVQKRRLWQAFHEWLEEEGLSYTGEMAHFFKDINSAGGRYPRSRLREKGKRVAYLNGLDVEQDFLDYIYQDAVKDFTDQELE